MASDVVTIKSVPELFREHARTLEVVIDDDGLSRLHAGSKLIPLDQLAAMEAALASHKPCGIDHGAKFAAIAMAAWGEKSYGNYSIVLDLITQIFSEYPRNVAERAASLAAECEYPVKPADVRKACDTVSKMRRRSYAAIVAMKREHEERKRRAAEDALISKQRFDDQGRRVVTAELYATMQAMGLAAGYVVDKTA